MISSTSPRCNYPLDLTETLRNWANSSQAEKDLETVFGQALHWPSAYRHLDAFRRGDFTLLPPVEVLEDAAMPGLWGGYSRDLRLVFLSEDCPEDLQTAVLLDEIGHFLDQELCTEETPGEEGAYFAALILGSPCVDFLKDEPLCSIYFDGKPHPVEAAPKVRGSAKTKATPAPKVRGKVVPVVPDTTTSQDGNVVYANKDSVRLVQTKANQRVIGSKGNDTFVVSSQNVRLEDPNGGTDTVETSVSFSLGNFSFIENLTAVSGTSAISLTGNAKANVITGNSGNNVLDGGVDSQKDTLIGGAGNDTYIIRDSLDVVTDSAGTDVIFTSNQSLSLSSYTNIEHICFIGTDGADFMFGGAGAGTLLGGKGNDTYFVDHVGDAVSETDSSTLTGGVDWVNARISHTLGSNVENIFKSGNANASLTGNILANIIDGSAGGINTLSGGAGNDTLIVNASRIGKVDGGANTDFLRFVGHSLTLNNAALTNIEALDLSSLTGNSAVTLGGNSTGLDTILGGAGADSITATTGFGNQTITLDGGDGDDRFTFSSVAQMAAASIFGGEGTDTLAYSSSLSGLVDSNFVKLSGSSIEVVQLNGIGNGVVLGANAEAAGIATIVGGTDNDTIDASGYTEGITIDVSRNRVVEGAANTENTVIGGGGGDLILFSNHNVLAASEIDGNDGLDTLAFAEDGVAITDDKFLGNISNVEVLQTADGTNFIQIGTNAESSGLESIIGGADNDTFDAAEFNSDIAIDAGDGDDSITLQNAARVATSTIEGGQGSDTLSLWEAGALADEDLINVSGIEILQAAESESSSIVVGQIAKAVGIQTVVAGIDNDILDARDFSGALALDGGEGDDHFFVSAGFDLRQKVVIGGIGSDTLSFTTNQLSVTDADFVGVDAVEYFKTANGNNRVVLGSSAQSAGISTIEGGTGRDTLSATGFASNVTLIGGLDKSSLVGGAGSDSLFGYDQADVLNGGDGIDTMEGGLGNDTYYIGDDGDWAIEGINSGNNLLIVDQEVELFNTVSGGGTTTFTIQGLDSIAGTTGDDSITGNTSSLNDAGQVMKTTSLNDTIDGGGGNDIIAGGRGKDSILGGNNNDSILGEAGNDTLRGDDGNDTILAGDGNDSVVGGDGNDSLIAGTGLDTLDGGAGNDTLTADATGSATLDGGADDDTFQFSSAAQIAASSIVGGAGTGDEIVLTKGGIFSDADFAKVSGVEIFDASVQEASRVSLGGNALRAGIRTLIGSDTKADFLSAALYTSEEITVLAGSGTTQDTLVAGSGSNRSSLVGNDGANYFEVGLASILGRHTIDGGAGIDSLSVERIVYGEDVVSIDSQIQGSSSQDSLFPGDQEFLDRLFTNISNIDQLYYDNRYFNSFVLADNFSNAFGTNDTASIFSTFDTDLFVIEGADKSDYFDLSGVTSKKVWLDVNHEVNGATIVGGQNANTLVGGRKLSAHDLFIFQDASWLTGASIRGGGGMIQSELVETLRILIPPISTWILMCWILPALATK